MSITLIIIACVLSFLSVFRPNIILSVAAAGFWFAVLGVLVSDPPSFMPAGSNSNGIVIIALSGTAVGILLYGVIKFASENRERRAEIAFYKDKNNKGKHAPSNFTAYMDAHSGETDTSESAEEYRSRVRQAKARGKNSVIRH
jgi:hypothetical protein